MFLLLPLALFHYFLQSKANVSAAVLASGFACWLVGWRLAPRRWQRRLALLAPLAVLAGLATAGIEAAWYGLATGANAWRVLAANLNLAFGPRPAVSVAICGLLVLLVASLRLRRRRPGALPLDPAKGREALGTHSLKGS